MMSALATTLSLSTGFALAADQAPAQEKTKTQVYGSQLMTQQERTEHHARMQERAKEQGFTLPDEPLVGGSGMENAIAVLRYR